MNEPKHIPVLCEEFLDFFKDIKLKTFIDGTLGAGGHAEALLKEHPEIELLMGFDQDESALKIAKERLKQFEGRVEFISANFCQIGDELKKRKRETVDGIFLDIGVSSMQIDRAERGFSFSKEGPLDMRMDQECSLTAEEIINKWSVEDLGHIFKEYGDLPKWRQLAKRIAECRKKKYIRTTTDLIDALGKVLSPNKRSLPPMTLIFQALRIAVNNELDVLKSAIPQAIDCLGPGGRLGIISFHSGEDRIVKNCFREASSQSKSCDGFIHLPQTTLLTKKPVTPSRKECRNNSRSRSAKMRFLEKISGDLS